MPVSSPYLPLPLLCGPELADIYKAQKRRKLA
jgi:hypothetical protein